jgi:cytochrome P450
MSDLSVDSGLEGGDSDNRCPVGLSTYDHQAVSGMASPFAMIAESRATCPVAHTTAHDGYWVLFRYDDVVAAAKDSERFSSSRGVTIPHHSFPIELPPIECDPPRQREFRAPLTPYFAPKAIKLVEPSVRRSVRALMSAFIEEGKADLAEQLTMRLPAMAITQLLNIPDEDRASFTDWTVRLIRDPEDLDAVGDAMEYFGQIYDDRRANPQDDIPTFMLGIEVEGQPISEEEYLCMLNVLVMAGLDTTANAAANILELLDLQPEIRARLIENPSEIADSIDELLRYVTPLPALARTTTEDVEINGTHIPAGDRVLLNWIAANHDPDVFADPETVNLGRSRRVSHVAFGAGAHRCLGAHLARLELVVLLEEVLRHIGDYQLDRDRVSRFPGLTRGIASLPVTFTPRSKATLAATEGSNHD